MLSGSTLSLYDHKYRNTHVKDYGRFLPEFGRNDDCRQDEQRGDGHGDVELRVHCNTHTYSCSYSSQTVTMYNCVQYKRRNQCSQLNMKLDVQDSGLQL